MFACILPTSLVTFFNIIMYSVLLLDIPTYMDMHRYRSATVKAMGCHISFGTLVPNSRDRQGKLWLLNSLENSL